MLDNLPPWLRHLAIVFGATFLGSIANTILTANGVTGVDWAQAAVDALNFGAASTATAAVALYLTPITKQYGVGSGSASLPEGVDE